MRIAQLSDLHLRDHPLESGIDPWAAFAEALARLATLQPTVDLLLLTGDMADDGLVMTYRRLAKALGRAGFDSQLLPGNHDERQALRSVFANPAWSGSLLCQRVDRGDVTLLLLDTVIAGAEGGQLTEAHIDWLDKACPAHRRVVVAMHHPPCPVGIPGMDAIGCAGGALLASWMAGRPQVEAVLAGHVHRLVVQSFAGKPCITCPSTVHQIALGDGPLAWTTEPPGLLIHDLLPGQAMRTHLLPVAVAKLGRYD